MENRILSCFCILTMESLPVDRFTDEAGGRESQGRLSDVVLSEQWLGGKWANLISFGVDAAIFDDFELKGVYFLKSIGLRTSGSKPQRWKPGF